MNVFGIGMPEMAVILLVAFLVLGPSRSITLARSAGKFLGDLKRTFNEVAAAAGLEEREQSRNSPRGSGSWQQSGTDGRRDDSEQATPVDHYDPPAAPEPLPETPPETGDEPPGSPPSSRAGDE